MHHHLCDCCNSLLGSAVYTPLNSRRGAEVYLCPECGLVQSKFYTNPAGPQKTKAISTDADWGNVRHGKGIRFTDVKSYLMPLLDELKPKYILDIGSNRGDFVKEILQKSFVEKIVAIEPDTLLTSDYTSTCNSNKLHLIWQRFEECVVEDKFDFIYSCQTLEHANSAKSMLEASHQLLKPDGYMYVEVPSIDILGDPRGVEEFFIDKHTFHFSRATLVNLVESCGFEIVDDFQSDDYNIKLLFRRIEFSRKLAKLIDSTAKKLIAAYPGILNQNRELLTQLVATRLMPLSKRQKVAYWGANRIFDALVKYGGLTQDDVFMLVDTHMAGKLDHSAGICIEHPDYLRVKEPQVCVVLARSSEATVASLAYDIGIRHVLKYSELLDQVASV